MKKILILLIVSAIAVCRADTIDIQIEPQNPVAGEAATLVLRANGAQPPEFVNVPNVQGLSWYHSSTFVRQQNINGRLSISAERRYPFVAEKAGTYTIPPAWVRVNGKEQKTKAITFTAQKVSFQTGSNRDDTMDINDIVFSKIILSGEKKTFFVGESIPVEIQVYCLSGVKFGLNYPDLNSTKNDIIFREFKTNQQNPRFDRVSQTLKTINKKQYICYVFNTEIKIISAGKQVLKAQTPTQISVPAQRSSRMNQDPFFDDFFNIGVSYRTINHTASAVTPVLDIKPLPPTPKGVHWLGLVGDWRVTPAISEKAVKVGTALTFTLNITGSGGLEDLRAPDLQLKNFRIYAPEISKEGEIQQTAKIRYTILPTITGQLPVAAKFCTFNNRTGTFSIVSFDEVVSVEKNPGVIPVANNTNIVDSAIQVSEKEEKKEHGLSGLMYLKPIPDAERAQNNDFWVWIIGILSFGALAVIISEILAGLFRGSSNAVLRKALAKKQKKSLMKQLKKAESEQVYELAPAISEYVNNALDLSPGTSLDESAERISQNNTELAEELKNISAGAWSPNAAVYSKERKENLMKLLTKLLCLLLCCSCTFVSAGMTQQTAMKAYDDGDFQKAREWYSQVLEKRGATPALLYNIGNCYFQEKEFAKALFCYEKAHLLAPRDPEVLRNLELTQRKLNLPLENKLNSPSDIPVFLRNQMTPEEWMILAATGVAFMLLAFGLRRFCTLKITFPIAIIGGLVLLFSAAMTVSQYRTDYAESRAIILENNVQLRTLPSEKSEFLDDEKLKAAEAVEIRERRNKWIRVKVGNTIGWVPAETVGQLNGRKFNVF